MIEFAVLALGAVGAGWLLRRRHRRRMAAGPVAGIPGMARLPAGAGRWRPGLLHAGPGGARWVPSRGEPVALTEGRATAVRAPSVKEGLSINPGSRIVTCAYPGGGSIEIAVMALDLPELLEAVPRAEDGS
ncbi:MULTISPECIES: hypothetical protein [unclassified Streptomyces]|uniref:hypothetical protein n=1 Tax=unclassified Streptomyces TaxID=2593676 RepID=UPI001BE6B185|nr:MULTISPECIES: hypothetical protein [unclassified Streptomyces]MBT2403567.1 hypothetical protein [Streptomyces sp. ISL-21]MBT2458405.1 hypothetical protein [Streptomyces sp. ISL-86]MBT2609956.1 hypothetical protein [Streptomyces sp. ISL-87]